MKKKTEIKEFLSNELSSAEEIKKQLSGLLHTAAIGEVVAYDVKTQLATIRPLIKEKKKSGGKISVKNIPLLYNVPVLNIGGGGYALAFPLEQGDEGLILFTDGDIDGWKQNGGIQEPATGRGHHLKDALFIPGFRSRKKSLSLNGLDKPKALGNWDIKGEKGDKGDSAYELAAQNGFQGTQAEYLISLKGEQGEKGINGENAYSLAVEQGFKGTLAEYLESLKGKNAYELAVVQGFKGTLIEYLESLRGIDGALGEPGESIYQMAVRLRLFIGSETDFVKQYQKQYPLGFEDGGTGGRTADEARLNLMNINHLITPENFDDVQFWNKQVGMTIAFLTKDDIPTAPSRYGIVVTTCLGNDIAQTWYAQASGIVCVRRGNQTAWNADISVVGKDAWVMVYDPNALTPISNGGTGARNAGNGRSNLSVLGYQRTEATHYVGVVVGNSDDTTWLRTTLSGLLPYVNDAGATNTQIGSGRGWQFSKIFGKELFEDGVSLSNKYFQKDTLVARYTNLNNITTPGIYYNPLNADADTMTNLPSKVSFALIVVRHAGISQTFIEYGTGLFKVLMRNYYNGTWTTWRGVNLVVLS